jgi:hypothetical protein
MKKTIAIVALTVTLASCGGSTTTSTQTDSTKVKVDSIKGKAVDSTKTVDTVKLAK